ncbi:MAG TPA: hypothetical protein VJ482_06115 [Acidimicrobiia bacterium]|nr:hypothetical protein [Acidimicrobiia bacterium]
MVPAVVGVWDPGKLDDRLTVTVAPLGPWPGRRWDDVKSQARRIGELIGSGEVHIERRDSPVDLLTSSRNRFLSPLAG